MQLGCLITCYLDLLIRFSVYPLDWFHLLNTVVMTNNVCFRSLDGKSLNSLQFGSRS